MGPMLLTLAAALLLAVALYAQWQIGNFTRGFWRIAGTRAVLGTVGIAFGLLYTEKGQSPFIETVTFVTGLGLVHVPAAIILFIKRRRGSGKT